MTYNRRYSILERNCYICLYRKEGKSLCASLTDNQSYAQKGMVIAMNENINEKWISIEDAAEHLGIKPVTVRDWIKKGKGIPAHKIGKKWKFKYSELDAWVKSGKSALE